MSAPVATRSAHPRAQRLGLRLGAGAFGGGAGGLVFAFIITARVLWQQAHIIPEGDTSMEVLIARLFASSEGLVVWSVHFVYAILIGALFALLFPPRGFRFALPLGLAWGFLHWLFGAWFTLRTLVGAPLVLDASAWVALAAHLAYGAILGVVYVLFFREEVQAVRHEGGFRPVRPGT